MMNADPNVEICRILGIDLKRVPVKRVQIELEATKMPFVTVQYEIVNGKRLEQIERQYTLTPIPTLRDEVESGPFDLDRACANAQRRLAHLRDDSFNKLKSQVQAAFDVAREAVDNRYRREMHAFHVRQSYSIEYFIAAKNKFATGGFIA